LKLKIIGEKLQEILEYFNGNPWMVLVVIFFAAMGCILLALFIVNFSKPRRGGLKRKNRAEEKAKLNDELR